MTDRPRYTRSSCCVPFCRRTSTLFRMEWLCADHWRLIDRRLKAFRTRHLRKLYRACEVADARLNMRNEQIVAAADLRGIHVDDPVWKLMDERDIAARRLHRADRLIWARMKRQAITRAALGA